MATFSVSEEATRPFKQRKIDRDYASQDVPEYGFHTPCTQTDGEVELETDITIMPALPEFPRTPASLSPTHGRDKPSEQRIASLEEQRRFSHVQVPRPTLTEAAFAGWEPPDQIVKESYAVPHLSKSILPDPKGEHLYLELEDFTIYRPSTTSKRGLEMCALDRIHANKGVDELQFSGCLSSSEGGTSVFLHGVRFSTVAVDGYGETECTSLRNRICLQSPVAKSAGIWYRLGSPSKEYKDFHERFFWLAMFTKYFLEFLLENDGVTLHRFRSGFLTWLSGQYGHTQQYQDWHRQCNFQEDFGTSVAAFVNYLYKECHSIDDKQTRLLLHPIWKEVDPLNLGAIKREPSYSSGATVVTPFVYRCFRGMYFAHHLEAVQVHSEVLRQIAERKGDFSLTPWNAELTPKPDHDGQPAQVLVIKQGDVICTDSNTASGWKKSKTEVWYAYVQSVRQDRKGNVKLDVLWLYEPSDTTLGNAEYPFRNELFLSDNCSCGKDAVPIEAVIAKVDVSWFTNDPTSTAGFFVRQKFETSEDEDSYSFVTLRSEDFSCTEHHLTKDEHFWKKYSVGDTVLALPKRSGLLQPMEILRMDPAEQMVTLRTFSRSSTVHPDAPPNELLPSEEIVSIRPSKIIRHCKIGHFQSRDRVRLPYTHDGVGDYFYTIAGPTDSQQSTLQKPSPSTDLRSPTSPLPGLDLFCGGGNFARGLEEAGIVKMNYAVDWDTPALHSYRANVERPEGPQYFLGSVNDLLRLVLANRKQKKLNIARIGNIHFIAAGSPCPGFSSMQPNKQSEQSLQFASMVASVVAFVDTYSPQYFVLENVVPMTHKIPVNGQQQNVFSQIVASLVAIGYQAQQFLEDAWSHGSSQQRSRVFIVASAPGTEPLQPPSQTHAHPPGKKVRRTLGKTTNGLPFGVRKYLPTPFAYVSAKEATADLPDIGDSLPQICPQFPDHRTHADQSVVTRQRLARVPIHPLRMGLAKAVHAGMITSGEAHDWVQNCKGLGAKPKSRAYSRIRPDSLFPTILTKLHLQCGINGNVLHWDQHRSITIMETRRAQGFLDHEVIVGLPSQQLKIVGNSVDRKVAFALGLALKDSWDATIKARRSILHGDDDTVVEDITEASDFSQNQPRGEDRSSDFETSEGEPTLERSTDFKDFLRSLRADRNTYSWAAKWAVEDAASGCRWSGDSPSDSLKVRRRLSELEAALREQ